ncbi:MAG: DNA polymerase IV [Thermodesulfobacteriota bacterium]
MHRHIIHLHVPAFPIAVARICRPELRGRPVVVAPPRSERAVILSASLEARREGVYKGMRLDRATKFCPELTVLPPDPVLTERAAQALGRKVSQYTPLWEPARPGHIYMDVTGTERLWGRAKDAALRLMREVKGDLRLAGRAGVAGNKMVSSIASRIFPSEGILDVDPGREFSFMAPLKVDMLPGIGPVRTRVLLEELSITLVRQIAVMDMAGLKFIFGRQAFVMHQRALGIDPTPVYPPSMEPTVSEEAVLPVDENDDEKLLGVLYGLVEKCSHQLRQRALFPGRAGLMFRYADQEEVIRQVSLPRPSFWDPDLYEPLEKAFLNAFHRRVRVSFMRVWFRDFASPDPQLSLFSPDAGRTGKRAAVTQALDRIRERHGGAVVQYGRTTGYHHRGTEVTEKTFCLSRRGMRDKQKTLPENL